MTELYRYQVPLQGQGIVVVAPVEGELEGDCEADEALGEHDGRKIVICAPLIADEVSSR